MIKGRRRKGRLQKQKGETADSGGHQSGENDSRDDDPKAGQIIGFGRSSKYDQTAPDS